jgi:hypothetical protein
VSTAKQHVAAPNSVKHSLINWGVGVNTCANAVIPAKAGMTAHMPSGLFEYRYLTMMLEKSIPWHNSS